jgi:hypothetical protein
MLARVVLVGQLQVGLITVSETGAYETHPGVDNGGGPDGGDGGDERGAGVRGGQWAR